MIKASETSQSTSAENGNKLTGGRRQASPVNNTRDGPRLLRKTGFPLHRKKRLFKFMFITLYKINTKYITVIKFQKIIQI
jgi:hypothetical protein